MIAADNPRIAPECKPARQIGTSPADTQVDDPPTSPGRAAEPRSSGPRAEVSEALRQALSDPDPRVVASSTIALRYRGDRQAIPLLFPLLDHPKWLNRLNAAEALLEMNVADARLMSALELLGREPEADEHDLNAAETNLYLDSIRQEHLDQGLPGPQPQMTLAEMGEQARQLLAKEAG